MTKVYLNPASFPATPGALQAYTHDDITFVADPTGLPAPYFERKWTVQNDNDNNGPYIMIFTKADLQTTFGNVFL